METSWGPFPLVCLWTSEINCSTCVTLVDLPSAWGLRVTAAGYQCSAHTWGSLHPFKVLGLQGPPLRLLLRLAVNPYLLWVYLAAQERSPWVYMWFMSKLMARICCNLLAAPGLSAMEIWLSPLFFLWLSHNEYIWDEVSGWDLSFSLERDTNLQLQPCTENTCQPYFIIQLYSPRHFHLQQVYSGNINTEAN